MTVGRYLLASMPLRMSSAGAVVAIPILAVRALDDVALGGGLVAASLAPAIIAAPLVGVTLDRTADPKALIVASAVATMAGFSAAALLGVIPLPVVVLFLVIAGLAVPFYMGGLSSLVTEEIENERAAYAYDALSYNAGSVVGPGIVAVVTASGSARGALWAMVAASAVGAVAALRLGLRGRRAASASVSSTLAAGIRHLARHRPLAVVTVSSTLTQVGAGALPIVAVALSLQRAGSPDDAAVIVTGFALGGLIGALFFTARPVVRLSAPSVMGVGFALIGVLTLAAAPDLGLSWTVASVALAGLLTAPTSSAMLLLRKQQSPVEVRSQVFTVGAALRAAASASGAGAAGLVVGVDAGLLVAGIAAIWLVSAAIMLCYPRGTEPLPEI